MTNQNQNTGGPSTRKRFTIGSGLRRTKEAHPGSVSMLDRTEVKMLTQVLHLDNTGLKRNEYIPEIAKLIENLPRRLRQSRPLSLGFKQAASTGASALCDLHAPLNADLISNIFAFVSVEVTEHFRLFEKYPELCQPIEEEILRRLRAMRGMWTKPRPGVPGGIPNAWAYQINSCQACMLARVASDREALRNLRVVILSRTRTRKNHRPRTLMRFVDECINIFGGGVTEEAYNSSNRLAFGMKAARKACTRCELRSRDSSHARDGNSKKIHQESRINTTHLMPVPEENFHERYNSMEDTRVEDSSTARNSINDVDLGPDAVDELIEMYKRLGKKREYSCHTPVPSAMVLPLQSRKKEDPDESRPKQKELLVDEIDAMDRLPQSLEGFLGGSVSRSSRDIPLKYQFSPSQSPRSENSSSDWIDEGCTDTEVERVEESLNVPRQSAGAETTWDMVCDSDNFI